MIEVLLDRNAAIVLKEKLTIVLDLLDQGISENYNHFFKSVH